ncbi:hypothetical protein Clacol_002632 [Clathrus columnatus]|uniref:F-box domain-containing protein n=1 Tax=Clathrus columnatus TaxID=1419009 RepID=A0AAV5A187_9AGAM|nr:hypothetical protein Clacol_002632 [Clathrus columnatus]
MLDSRDGKRAVHNWANLPPEVLRLVVANYLAYKPHAYTPASWLHPDFYYQRSVFETLRDAYDVERIMRVCPQWHSSLLNMDFWFAACRRLDRADLLSRPTILQTDYNHLQQLHPQSHQQFPPQPHHLQQQQRHQAASVVSSTVIPFRRNFNHFHTLTRMCCLPCRVNRPLGRDGVGNVKGSITTAHFGQVSVCKSHRVNYFCGICLKDATLASEGDHGQFAKVPESLFENEDFDTWPSVHTTCYHCRREALLRAAANYSSSTSIDLFSFIGGPTLETKDYEARSTVENFVDMAEGGINDVIKVLLERHWLRVNTNLGSLLDQAVASARYARAEIDDYESEDDMLSDDEEDSYDMLQSQEENGIRMLAVTAWARTRIMDGNWVTPGDLWYAGTGQLHEWDPSILPPTLRPISYSPRTSPSNQSLRPIHVSDQKNDDDISMSLSEIDSPLVIHYPITSRFVPLPSYRFAQLASSCFRNTLREILFEPLRHLVYQLARESQAAKQDPCVRLGRFGLDDILIMLRDERMWYVVDSMNGNTRLAHHIPYIPANTENMPPMTKGLLENFWREACAPLYQCQCSICDRALQVQAQAQGRRLSVSSTVQQEGNISVVNAPIIQDVCIPVPVKQPGERVILEEEEDNEDEEAIVINVDADADGDVDADVDVDTLVTTFTPPDTGSGSGSDAESSRSRKRSSESIDEDEDELVTEPSHEPSPQFIVPNTYSNSSPGSSPRKKQRMMITEEEEEESTIDSASLPVYSGTHAKPRAVPFAVIPSEEMSVGSTSFSPASSVSSSVAISESSFSSPSLSSESSSLPSVASGPIMLSGRETIIKPGIRGVEAAPSSDLTGASVAGDTVKIRGKDDTPSLLYNNDEDCAQDMEEYYV